MGSCIDRPCRTPTASATSRAPAPHSLASSPPWPGYRCSTPYRRPTPWRPDHTPVPRRPRVRGSDSRSPGQRSGCPARPPPRRPSTACRRTGKCGSARYSSVSPPSRRCLPHSGRPSHGCSSSDYTARCRRRPGSTTVGADSSPCTERCRGPPSSRGADQPARPCPHRSCRCSTCCPTSTAADPWRPPCTS